MKNKFVDLLNLVASRNFFEVVSTREFVPLRHHLINSLVSSMSTPGSDTEKQLQEIQLKLDNFRAQNDSPICNMTQIVALMEEQIVQIERIAKELKSLG